MMDAAETTDRGTAGRVLVVEDDAVLRKLLEKTLGEHGYGVDAVETGEAALEALERDVYDIVLLDLNLPKMDGMEVLRLGPARQPDAQFVIMTAFGTVDTAVEAMKQGAFDYINKPFNTDELLLTLRRAREEQALRREVARLRQQVQGGEPRVQIVGRSPAIRRVLDLVARVAPSRATVLITGETGTGKELVARAIHEASDRAGMPFVAINCAAIPENLLESELFGHVRGAFTGAIANKKGLIEEASGGTLFLDEISTMSLELQAKLLRVLQERVILRVGGRQPIPVNIRLIAATNIDLARAVQEKAFREDLYYRLSVFPIHVPALRERKEDIPLLANYFLRKYADQYGCEPPSLTPATLSRMVAYDWPGNVRELENFIERMVVLHAGGGSGTIGFDLAPSSVATERDLLSEALDRGWTLEQLEKEYILRTLDRVRWRKTEAAQWLGIDRRTLYRKLRRYQEEGTPTNVRRTG
jgi:two-component system response regulator PilR (NtrC family)